MMSATPNLPPLALTYAMSETAAASGPSAWAPMGRIMLIAALILGSYRCLTGVVFQYDLAKKSSTPFSTTSYSLLGNTVSADTVRLYGAGNIVIAITVAVGAVFAWFRFAAARYVVLAGVGMLAASTLLGYFEQFRFLLRSKEYGWIAATLVSPMSWVAFALIAGFTLTRPRLFAKHRQ